MSQSINTPGRKGLILAALAALTLSFGIVAAQQPQYSDQANDALVADDQADPPSQVARISVLTGTASVQPASVQDFTPAEANYPLTTGDRIYTDAGATAELETGQLALRAGQQTDLTVTGLTDTLQQFGLAEGSAHLRTFVLDPNATVELDTPNVAITVLQPGDVRIDCDPNSDVTVVTVLSGQVQVNGNGIEDVVHQGESLRLTGANPVSARLQRNPRTDGLDRFSADRDTDYQNAQADNGYVNTETIGASDLNQYGDWQNAPSPDSDGGAVWFPRGVSVDWQPYSVGHWAWIAPWGWTWVESEPWGFAPFHYGRWARFGPRWGWIPGPPVIRPVWSPALVVFVGGPRAGGVAAWFPLGPREPFVPWYHAGPRYVNRVNVTNIYTRNTVEVNRIYQQRTNVYINNTVVNRTYVNRQQATVAMPQDRFAQGRSVRENQVHIAPGQLAGAPVLPHPMITPQRPIIARGPAQALPPHIDRPVLASHEDNRVHPGPAPVGNPGRVFGGSTNNPPAPVSRPDPVREPGRVDPPNPGRTGPIQTQPPTQPPTQPRQGQVDPPNPGRTGPIQTQPPTQPRQGQVEPPNPGRTGPIQTQPPIQPPTQPRQGQVDPPIPGRTGPIQTQPPTQPRQGQQAPPRQGQVDPPNPGRTGPVQMQTPVQPPAQPEPQRPLFNRAVPPPARPDFEQQRQAIQQTDPGRPLGPRQLDNLRQNQPAGPPQQREAAPHPAPAPAPKPAPAPPARPDDKKKN